ncbi:hypothetical protein UlMin_043673 [Ulmus minor]
MDELVTRTVKLNVQDEDGWEIPLEDPTTAIEFSLVGRLMTKKPWNKKLMTTILRRIWGVDDGWNLKILDQKENNCYIALSFKDKELYYWFVEKRPWLLNGGVLLVNQWPISGVWQSARLSCYSCWGKAFGIPLRLLTTKNIEKIISSAGVALEVDFESAKTSFWRNFVRFKVEIDVDKSICPGRFVLGDNKPTWVQFKFKKLSFMCFKCGMIGHDKAGCDQPLLSISDIDGKDIPVLGPWLRMDDTTKDCFEATRVRTDGSTKKTLAWKIYGRW